MSEKPFVWHGTWDQFNDQVRDAWNGREGKPLIAHIATDATDATADPGVARALDLSRDEITVLTNERDKYRDVLRRLADEDACVLDEGLGGSAQEELHVRTSLAAQALGLDVCGCSECRVSLGIETEDE